MTAPSPTPRRAFLSILVSAPAALVVACASGSSSGNDGTEAAPRRRRNRISREELAETPPGDLFLTVQRLRPQWLGRRGIGGPAVHVDGRFSGHLEVLQTIDVNEVQEVRFRSAADATTLYGTNYPAGVIEVTTRR